MFWVRVSCGVELANGDYKPTGKKREDAYIYRNANGFELSREKVDKIGWILGRAPQAYYGIPSKSLTPPQRGWKCYKGSKPAPTITYHKEKPKEKVKPSRELSSGKMDQCVHRTKVYEEIIVTEEKYVQKLKILVKEFLEPLQEEAYLPEELKTMLHLCRDIQTVANDLLDYIHLRIRQRPSLVVSSAFIKFAPTFVCYTPYCVRFMSANKTLGALMKDDKKFRQRVNEISLENDNESLDSLLIRPVQRITKYHLFFRDLLASLDSSHPHREALETALATVKDIAQQVNKDLFSAEKSAGKLQEIYRIMNGSCEDLVKPGRIFQMELNVRFRLRHVEETKKLYAYVFSDLLVLAKPAPSLRNKHQQKMVHSFYHRSLTLEKTSEATLELYLKNITNIKDTTCVDRYILCCPDKDKFESLCKVLDHLKQKQRQKTLSLKRHRGTSRATGKRGSLAAMEDKYRKNKSTADADSISASAPSMPKPRAWTRPRGSSGTPALTRSASAVSVASPARRWTVQDNRSAAAEAAKTLNTTTSTTTTAAANTATPGRRKWASLRRGELSSKKKKFFTGTLDAQALKDLKAMSLRDEKAAAEASATAAAARQYTGEELEKMAKYRKGIYKEIRDTEREYVASLELLVNAYKVPLLRKKIITAEEGRIIFSNVEGLLRTSKLLMQLLSGMDREGRMSKVVVDAFKMIVPTFKAYSVYCKAYQPGNEMFKAKMSSVQGFKKFVNAEQNKSKKGGKLILLQDLIIKPVQRICKYPLFFKAILDHTEDGHPTKNDFDILLKQIQQIANLVDARVKEYRERSKVVSVFNSVEGAKDDLVSSNRRFLEDMEIEFGSLSGSSVKYSKSKLFVFTDRLMVAKVTAKKLFAKSTSLKFKNQFDMVDIKISDCRDNPLELDITSVKTEGTVTVTKFRLRFANESDKDRIKELIEEQRNQAFAADDDLQERKSKAVKTRTWTRKKRVAHVNERLAGMRAKYQNRRGTL